MYDLVVGYLVHLSIEDQVPADRLLVSGFSLLINESSLTGESETVNVMLIKKSLFHYQEPNSKKICRSARFGWVANQSNFSTIVPDSLNQLKYCLDRWQGIYEVVAESPDSKEDSKEEAVKWLYQISKFF